MSNQEAYDLFVVKPWAFHTEELLTVLESIQEELNSRGVVVE